MQKNRWENYIVHILDKLEALEEKLQRMDQKQDVLLSLTRNNQKTDDSDESLLYGCPYNDISAKKALKIINDDVFDFILLDVSEKKAPSTQNFFPNAIRIPLEDLELHYTSLINKLTPVIVISEDGIRSLLACEFLASKGHYNLANVSGGYEKIKLIDPAKSETNSPA